MYKISVPLMCGNITRAGRDDLLAHLRELNAERVFLALSTYEFDPLVKKRVLDELADHCAFFHEQGFEVGVWTWTFWVRGEHSYRLMKTVDSDGSQITNSACPTDERFVDFAAEYIADLAKCGVDLIMFDDDFRYSVINGSVACLCDAHIRMIEKKTGESLDRAALRDRILSGGKNKFRDAWLEANGEAFEYFARRVRQSVDRVNPKVRIGACACLSSWDIDGIDAYRLARILAGDNKPFVRLIGAPYWAARGSWDCMLQDVIEQERMESVWTRNGEIEIMAEGDAYPRPRLNCPAAYLEGFDTAIRASGATDGILKYGIDYTSSANYETGYVKAHRRNRPLYGEIDRLFGDKTATGVRVYEFPQKVADMEVGEKPVHPNVLQYSFFSTAARSLSACSIPTTYEGRGVCGACFGPSARYLTPEMRKGGLIVDAEAARILHSMGVDVGIETLGKRASTTLEHFLDPEEYTVTQGMAVYRHIFREGIKVCSEAAVVEQSSALSHMTDDENATMVPMSYLYENRDGERYLVLNFDTRFIQKGAKTDAMRYYERSRQYASAVEWLSHGKHLPAFCFGNPNLYTMTKTRDGAMAVGLWNFFADTVVEPTVKLDRAYTNLTCIGCSGKLEGDTVTLTDIPAFGFVGFEVS